MNFEKKLRERIWITSRCHMKAERRNRFLEIYFHLLLAFYAISGIGNSILGSATNSEVNGAILLYISILTLSISLIIFGFKFGELATQHRTCYLTLQRILAPSFKGDLNEKYISTIENLPNHKEIDFLRTVIDDPFSRKQSLKKPDGTPYEFSQLKLASYIVRRISSWAFLTALTTPAWLVTFWNFKNIAQ
ncbi:SLATT domain-containing protein [Celeribacter sp.]|uniref:SLATT domain-containing protein n=1 Tax=Celeribacter sp. TaxID=1890673 RepID=UPI003A8CC67B